MLNNLNAYTDSIAFITQGGVVSILVALLLVIMSLMTWYLILFKTYQILRLRLQYRQYAKLFWQSNGLDGGAKLAARYQHAMAGLTTAAISAAKHYRTCEDKYSIQSCSYDEFILRAMRQSFNESSFQIERGLTALATVGSVAPFLGLFGTVWGIYHALISISVKQQATLDAVAGPVGEALIMTAIGLAVAIPAVLAYNFILRAQRALSMELGTFSNQLHIMLTTGKPMINDRAAATFSMQTINLQEQAWAS